MTDVNRIEVSADFQDITITVGEYGDVDARQAISVVDAGGDGSLAYNNATGVITYTGPSAADVRAHFSAGTGISLVNGVITNTSLNTNTTYTQDVTATTGGANLNLRGSDSTVDTVKFAAGAGITVAETDASTITVTSTITQYTDALARQAISVVDAGGDGSLSYNNGTGVITYTGPSASEVRAHFTGGTGVSITNGDIALDFSEFSTTNVVEGTNLYYTDARFDTRLATKTTTNLAEGTNLYYTDARARAAISVTDSGGYGELSYNSGTGVITYTGPSGSDIRTEVQDGRNLTYTSAVLDLDKALVDVNSVTTEAATDLTVTGDRLVIKTRDVGGVADTFLTLDADGYRFSGSSTPVGALNGSGIDAYVTSAGTTSEQFYAYYWSGTLIGGSNQITNCRVYGWDDTGLATALDWTITESLVLNKPIHIAGNNYVNLQLGVKVGSIAIDPGNSTIATITMATSDGATTAVAQSGATITNTGYFAHYMRNSASTGVALLGNWQSVQGTGTFTAGSPIVVGFTRSLTGLLAFQAVAYWSHSYTVAPTGFFSGRRILTLQTTNATNEHINIPFALGVGPGAVSTNRGVPSDLADAIGINLYNPGTIRGYNGRTIFNLTQATDNSFYTGSSPTAGSASPIEKSGGQFQFNHVRGNSNSAISAIYARTGDGLGGLTWWTNSGSAATSLVSSTHTPAGIYAVATEDQTGSTTTSAGQPAIGSNTGQHATASGKHGTGIAMQYTPNASGVSRPRTFLAANDKTLELRSVDSVVLKPVSKTSSNTTDRSLFSTVNHTWLTAGDYVLGTAASATTGMINGNGAKVTVGMTSASGNDGDVGLVLQRATGSNTANFELKLPNGSANTLQLINNATSTTIATVTDSAIAVNANTRVTGGLRTYGEFAYTGGNITIAAQNTIYAFPLDTTLVNSGTSISNTSRINISRTGFFKIIMSLQATSVTNGVNSFVFWLRKNGADVANSKTEVDFLKDQKSVIAMDWLVESDGDDYWEIVYATASANFADITFPTIAATTTPYVSPLAPALIVNVIPIGL